MCWKCDQHILITQQCVTLNKSHIFYKSQFLHQQNGPTAVFRMFGISEMSLKATTQFLIPQPQKPSLTVPFPHYHHLQFRAMTVGFALKTSIHVQLPNWTLPCPQPKPPSGFFRIAGVDSLSLFNSFFAQKQGHLLTDVRQIMSFPQLKLPRLSQYVQGKIQTTFQA